MKRIFNKKGFTLVELLIVIAVLGIIAGIGVTSMSGVTKTFKEKADIETGRQLARQVEVKVLAGELSLALTDAQIKASGITYPSPQSGGTGATFVLTAESTGHVIVSVKGSGTDATTVPLTDNDDDDDDGKPSIKIATAAVE